MGISNFPNGIYATPLLGAGRLSDMWNSGNIYFVDGYAGSVSNTGLSPTAALALPSEAISACKGGATIYIRPIGMNYDQSLTTNYQFYTDDIIIPFGKSGISLVGAGEPRPLYFGGVALKPSTVTGSLIDIRSNSNIIENMHLTLVGGTADQADGATTWQTIILMHRDGSNSRCYGNVIRGNRFSHDASHPSFAYGGGAIVNWTAQNTIIENNLFENCLGGVQLHSHAGDTIFNYIRGNTFSGNPANRDCDLVVSINAATCHGNCIYDNIFADGLPTHAGNYVRFIHFPYVTAGTGIIANNYFATATVTNGFGEGGGGSQAIVAANMFMAGNYYEGTGTTAPYGLITT